MKSPAGLVFAAALVVISLILVFKPRLFERPTTPVRVDKLIAENCPKEGNQDGHRVVICNKNACRCGTYEEYQKDFPR